MLPDFCDFHNDFSFWFRFSAINFGRCSGFFGQEIGDEQGVPPDVAVYEDGQHAQKAEMVARIARFRCQLMLRDLPVISHALPLGIATNNNK